MGDSAPDFTLQSSTGENVSLSQFLGKKNLFFSFIRGTKVLLVVKKQRRSEITMKPSKTKMRK